MRRHRSLLQLAAAADGLVRPACWGLPLRISRSFFVSVCLHGIFFPDLNNKSLCTGTGEFREQVDALLRAV